MRNAVVVHGKPTHERYLNPDLPKPHEANWLPWLGAELAERGVSVTIPAFWRPYYPDYNAWEATMQQCYVDSHTGLIGHSTGADFLLRWLSEDSSREAERLVLVGPWHDSAGKYGEFSQYDLDTDLYKRVGRITIFNSTDDTPAIQENAHRLFDALTGAHLYELEGYGHFMIGNNMDSEEFPKLLEDVLI